MKKIMMLLVAVVILSGCAHRPQMEVYWFRPNSTEQEFNVDKYECQKEVIAVSGQQSYWAYGSAGFVAISNAVARRRAENTAQALWESCMQSRGWTKQYVTRESNLQGQLPVVPYEKIGPPAPNISTWVHGSRIMCVVNSTDDSRLTTGKIFTVERCEPTVVWLQEIPEKAFPTRYFTWYGNP